MTVISISSHQVDSVAVFIPEGSLIGQSTVGDSDVVVMVISGEWAAMVVGHRVTCRERTFTVRNHFPQIGLGWQKDRLYDFGVGFTCRPTISSYMDLVAGPRFRDRELVIMGVGCLSLVSEVDPQLVLTSSCDLMQVGQT